MKTRIIRDSVAIIALFLLSLVPGINIFIPLVLTTIFIYVEAWKGQQAWDSRFLHLILLFLVHLAICHWIFINKLSVVFIPFSLVPMLVIILWQDLRVSLLMILACSFSIGIYHKSIDLAILSFVSTVVMTVLLLNVRRRSQILGAGCIVGLFQVLVWWLMQNFQIEVKDVFFVLNGCICGVVVAGVLSVFEFMFDRITNISLLEMADFNSPVLKKLMLEAPGTYHHSLVVGNLAEAACEAVNANALLARIGAYYHDIGKIEKAEYFIENQNLGSSKHEDLAPSMSRLVIINHVKEGEVLARRHRLNTRIIDFICQHHGTSLVYYFYHRALENKEEDQKIPEEGFRYSGPKPRSKETAIVLLADSVEAATRSLREPTPNRIEQEVHKIVNNKFIDGQLDECDLTLRDLEKISGIFIRLLASIYHSRVTYPETSRAGNNQKSTKEDSSKQKSNKSNSRENLKNSK